VADLRVLATSDLHVQLVPHDYHADRPAPDAGLARLAVLIEAERRTAANTLLLDNGDFLQGNPLADYVAEVRGLGGAPHPAIAAMNAIGYDACALGNHEFDYGLPFLQAALAAARFPVVASNLDPLAPEARIAAPLALLNRQVRDRSGRIWPLTIGIVGFLPPQVLAWNWPHLRGRVAVRGIVEAARRSVAVARAGGANVVIALSHSGLGPDVAPNDAEPDAENATLALARVEGVDAVVAGHSHHVFPHAALGDRPGVDVTRGLIAGRPGTMPGFAGSHLGVIDLTLVRTPAGGWRVADGRGRVRAAAEAPAGALAAPVMAAAAADHAATVAHFRRPVGESAVPLTTYLALVEPCAAVRLIAEAQRAHVEAALAGGPHAGLPVLSAAAPFRAGGRGGPACYTDVPAGPVSLRHLAELSPYPNTLCALRLDGRTVRAWLEHASAAFLTVPPGARDAPLIDPDWPAYNFDTLWGLSYTLDLARPAGEGRVRDVMLDGAPLADDAAVIVAANSYRAMGGGAFPGASPAAVVHADETRIRDAIAAYLARIGRFAPTARPSWRFAPMPGTTVTLETGPGVRPHLGPRYTEIGTSDSGFVQLRLAL
jgi:2',3'-cyclic-nucleotide 2'-phosphodiesterase/3'-nucleotidase